MVRLNVCLLIAALFVSLSCNLWQWRYIKVIDTKVEMISSDLRNSVRVQLEDTRTSGDFDPKKVANDGK